jgi:hypothetical protein
MSGFGNNLEINQHQLLKAVFENRIADPDNPVEGEFYWKTLANNKKLLVFDSALNEFISIAGDITGVTTETAGQLQITSEGGPIPVFNIKTAAIASGVVELATGGQIYDFVSNAVNNGPNNYVNGATYDASLGKTTLSRLGLAALEITGFPTQSTAQLFTNKTGNISQWTNDSQYELQSNKGVANGYAPLDSQTLIPSQFLPSFVDDVLEFADKPSFPSTGETGKIYVALDDNKTYRWGGSTYVYITSGAVDSVNGQTGVVVLTTSHITEGSRLYYTQARFNTSFSAKSTTDLSEGSNLYYTDTRVKTYGDTQYSLLGHTHVLADITDYIGASDADNYSNWNLKTNNIQRTGITSGGVLDLVAGTNVGISYSAGGVVTISSTQYDDTALQTEVTQNSNARHTHANKPTLDKFGEDVNGLPTYNGNSVDTTIAQRDVYDGLNGTDNTISLSATQGTALKTLSDNQQAEINLNNAKVTDSGIPAILSDGITPTLNSGISAEEIRTLIGASAGSGSGSYIQNQDALDQVANLRINGTGQFGGSVTATSLLLNSGEYLSWGTVGSTSIEGSTASNKLRFRTNGSQALSLNEDQSAHFASSINATDGLFSESIKLETSLLGINSILYNDSHNAVFQIKSGNAKNSEIWFGDIDNNDVGKIKYNHIDNSMSFVTNGLESLRLKSDRSAQFLSSISATDGIFSGNISTIYGKSISNSRTSMNPDGTFTWGNNNDFGTLSWSGSYALVNGQSGIGLKIGVNGNNIALTVETDLSAVFASTVSSSVVPTQDYHLTNKLYVDGLVLGSGIYVNRGDYAVGINSPRLDNRNSDTVISGIKSGYTYKVIQEGIFYEAESGGVQLRPGDVLTAKQDNPSQTSHWIIVQGNIDFATYTAPGIASFNPANFNVGTQGQVEISNGGIQLGLHTAGDYVSRLSVGVGLDTTSPLTGAGNIHNITLDLADLSTQSDPELTHYIVGVNGTNSNKKFTVQSILDLGKKTISITGNGSQKEWVLTHSFGIHVIAQVVDSSGNTFFLNAIRTANNVTFKFDKAPANGVTFTGIVK